ncbi:MAG: pyridoxamine 5'-phosphate oxidase family protein [Clostridiaceae bacterium]|nr:pyridoxamine 5'-phosphate oxidase family protein [Clostridiaceae bacterium]
MDTGIKNEIINLRKNSNIAFISSIDEKGYPTVKAMLVLENESMKIHYFSTNLSSRRVKQFMENPKAAVYYCNSDEFKGLMLQGRMEVLTDREHKKMLWREGFEIYYPNGIDDEDYCVLRFTAEKGNYYHGLANINFEIEEVL